MNRVLLCGVCVGAVRSLLGEKCASVTLFTASDGSSKQKVKLDLCENAQAVLHHEGICYEAKASFTEDGGITLSHGASFMEQTPGLVTLIMQNTARYVTHEGVEISCSVHQT